MERKKEFMMYVMIGVPGSGKNYYIEHHLPSDIVTISRDDIRKEIGIEGEKPMGTPEQEELVSHIAEERLKECCRKGVSFVINNTNVKRRYRNEYRRLVEKYNPKPKIVFVYCKPSSIDVCKERRKGMMPEDVIDRMWANMCVPQPDEYDELIIFET